MAKSGVTRPKTLCLVLVRFTVAGVLFVNAIGFLFTAIAAEF